MYPPRGAGKRIGVSILGGIASRASSTRRVVARCGHYPSVLPPSLNIPPVNRLRTCSETRLTVNVGAVETEQLFRAQAGADGEDRDRPVARVELVRDLLHVGPRLERRHLAPLVPLPLRVLDPDAKRPGSRGSARPPTRALAGTPGTRRAATRRERHAPVLELEPVRRVGMPVAELARALFSCASSFRLVPGRRSRPCRSRNMSRRASTVCGRWAMGIRSPRRSASTSLDFGRRASRAPPSWMGTRPGRAGGRPRRGSGPAMHVPRLTAEPRCLAGMTVSLRLCESPAD